MQPQLELLSKDGDSIDQVPSHSLARVDYANAAEGAVNEQVCFCMSLPYINTYCETSSSSLQLMLHTSLIRYV